MELFYMNCNTLILLREILTLILTECGSLKVVYYIRLYLFHLLMETAITLSASLEGMKSLRGSEIIRFKQT